MRRNKKMALIILLLLAAVHIMAQTFPIDTAKLNSSFRTLVDNPNAVDRQKAFFDAFPNTWNEFIMTYQYVPDANYDLTMYDLAHKQIEALGEKMTLINDTLYCQKLVNVAIGAMLEADAPSYYQNLLHKVMTNKNDVMLYAIGQLRKGYQMLFWQFYWSNPVKSKPFETEFNDFLKKNSSVYPKEMEMMKIAFDYFYDGVNIDGGYLIE